MNRKQKVRGHQDTGIRVTSQISLCEEVPWKGACLPKLSQMKSKSLPRERRQPHREKRSVHSLDSDNLARVPSNNTKGAPRRPLTCRRHQRAEPHTRALNLQIHDREAAHGHQLLQLFSQLQGKGQNECTVARRAPVSPCPLSPDPRGSWR